MPEPDEARTTTGSLAALGAVPVAGFFLTTVRASGAADAPAPVYIAAVVILGAALGHALLVDREVGISRAVATAARLVIVTLLPITLLALVEAAVPSSAFESAGLRDGALTTLIAGTNWWMIARAQSPAVTFGSASPFVAAWPIAVGVSLTAAAILAAAIARRSRASTRRTATVLGALATGALLTKLVVVASGAPTARLLYGTDMYLGWFFGGLTLPVLVTSSRMRTIGAAEQSGWAAPAGLAAVLASFALGTVIGTDAPLVSFACELLAATGSASLVAAALTPNSPLAGFLARPKMARTGAASLLLYATGAAAFTLLDRARLGGQIGIAVMRLATVAALALPCSILAATVGRPRLGRPRIGRPRPRPRTAARAATAGVLLLLLVLVGSTVVITRPGVVHLQAGSTDASGRLNALLIGDSMPYTLGLGVATHRVDLTDGINAQIGGLPGCGISYDAAMKGGVIVPRSSYCDPWESLWKSGVTNTGPAFSVLLAWAWELYDRVLDPGTQKQRLLRVGSDAWNEWMGERIQHVIDLVTVDGAPVVLLTFPCLDQSNPDMANHQDPEEAQPHRVAAVNATLRTVAARPANRRRTAVLDLNAYLCPDGTHYRARIDGVLITTDNIHFTPEGGEKVWTDFLGPQLRRLFNL